MELFGGRCGGAGGRVKRGLPSTHRFSFLNFWWRTYRLYVLDKRRRIPNDMVTGKFLKTFAARFSFLEEE
jgi:hypothetical protein